MLCAMGYTPCSCLLCYAMLCYAMLCCAVLCCAVPCRAVPCRAVPCRAVPCRAMPCHAMPCASMGCAGMGWRSNTIGWDWCDAMRWYGIRCHMCDAKATRDMMRHGCIGTIGLMSITVQCSEGKAWEGICKVWAVVAHFGYGWGGHP